MSRTIEIISRHKGKIRFKCKGEQRLVVFEDKGNVGVAKVNNDEAEVFLKVGKPDFWKETTIELKPPAKPQDDQDDKKPAQDDQKDNEGMDPGKGTGEAGEGNEKKDEVVTKRKHTDVIADIKVAETVEAVDALIVGEERPSVLSAADIRKEDLTTPA